ncbi:MAG: hypothetical protein KDI38_28340, partial [Calditrichaeota bacterium]|nr:hypothetical protein [Calditrichota bacterium]
LHLGSSWIISFPEKRSRIKYAWRTKGGSRKWSDPTLALPAAIGGTFPTDHVTKKGSFMLGG